MGKPQLDEDEAAILFQWIKSGANFKQKVNELPATDSLRMLANNLFGKEGDEVYDFSAASEKEIEKLNNTNRLIHPLALESPALAVNFYNRQNYTTASLKELQSLKTQVVSLDLAYMPLNVEDINAIAQFTNLRRLNLNFSTVPGNSLAALNKLSFLTHLNLSGTGVTTKDLEAITAFPKLQTVSLWNVVIPANELTALKKRNNELHFETGFVSDTIALKLNPPVLETEERIVNGAPLSLHLRHYIKGTVIHYTTDGSTPDSVHAAVYKDSVVLDKAGVFNSKGL